MKLFIFWSNKLLIKINMASSKIPLTAKNNNAFTENVPSALAEMNINDKVAIISSISSIPIAIFPLSLVNSFLSLKSFRTIIVLLKLRARPRSRLSVLVNPTN
jgi:hypothetical protein